MDTDKKPCVLIVDDEADHLLHMQELLHQSCRVELADGARVALRIAQELVPDLIVLEASMPEMSGIALCQQLKSIALTAPIPVIVLVAGGDSDEGGRALRAGAADYLPKPVDADTLRARVATHLQLNQAQALLRDQARHLEHLVAERTREVSEMQDAAILAMSSLAETRDSNTCNHIRRTQHYVAALACELQSHPRFAGELVADNIALLFRAAPLHDIGKVGVPDAILLKPGRLTDAEYETMKLHTVYGRDAILNVEKHFGMTNNFLRFAREIAHSHQERWDGSGYPQGLEGDAIPVSARLMAVADVYDAMISKRVYKPAFTHETAIELIRQGRGEHFDPEVVDAMLAVEEDIMAIAARFADPE